MHVDILTGEKLRKLANMDIIYWSVRSFSLRGEDGVKGLVEG